MTLNLIISVTLLATIIATGYDLKYKIVPNFINYFLIIFGLGAGAILSLLTLSHVPILLSAIGAGAFYGIGALLYYSGVWGGGDAKLLAGFGATLTTVPAIVMWPFIVTIFLNILICGMIIGLIGSLYLGVKHHKKLVLEARKTLARFKKTVVLFYILLPFTVAVFFLTSNLLILLTWGFAVMFFYLYIALKALETACMYRKIKPSQMQEGDWVTKPVKVKGKLIYQPEKSGISIQELKKLQKLESQGKLKTVNIKEGIQYVPAFLLALILSLLKIDIMFYIFSRLMQ